MFNKINNRTIHFLFQLLEVHKANFSFPLGVGSIFIISLFLSFSVFAGQKTKLVILHTNDTHSQVEPTDNNASKKANMGGYARRMGEIAKIRSEEKNVLLVDAGDFSQGTPYFNFYNGRVEVDAMNRMKYDAITLGNHEFDNGIDTLSVILKKANFAIVSSNYGFENSSLWKLVKPYIVIVKDGLRIGIMGLGVEPKGLVIEDNYKGLQYSDPVETANEISTLLKRKEKCDVVICLSHLGADTISQKITDFTIAHKTRYIDVIIGGHSHSMITNTTEKNAAGNPIVIAQMAKSGLYLGRIELEFEKIKK